MVLDLTEIIKQIQLFNDANSKKLTDLEIALEGSMKLNRAYEASMRELQNEVLVLKVKIEELVKQIEGKPNPLPVPTTMKDVKLSAPFRGKTILVENQRIDCNGLKRVFVLERGQTITVKNCHFYNVGESIIEQDTEGVTIVFEGVIADVTPRYAIYIASKDANLKPIYTAANVVKLNKCNFLSSQYETPVRINYGCNVYIDNTTIMDTIDIGANKANMGIRIHGVYAEISNSTFGKGTKLGRDSEQSPNSPKTIIKANNVDFIGFCKNTGLDYDKSTFTNCKRNGTLADLSKVFM